MYKLILAFYVHIIIREPFYLLQPFNQLKLIFSPIHSCGIYRSPAQHTTMRFNFASIAAFAATATGVLNLVFLYRNWLTDLQSSPLYQIANQE